MASFDGLESYAVKSCRNFRTFLTDIPGDLRSKWKKVRRLLTSQLEGTRQLLLANLSQHATKPTNDRLAIAAVLADGYFAALKPGEDEAGAEEVLSLMVCLAKSVQAHFRDSTCLRASEPNNDQLSLNRALLIFFSPLKTFALGLLPSVFLSFFFQ
jgi:hypothetical protein